MKLRPYQQEAVNAWKEKKGVRGVIVMPTGSGKSLVASEIAKLGADEYDHVIVAQPSAIILEQNLEKIRAWGNEVGVFSASLGEKSIGKVTVATIQSIHKHYHIFAGKRVLLVIDECHERSHDKKGMYDLFIERVGCDVVGLTATPVRTYSVATKGKWKSGRFVPSETETRIANLATLRKPQQWDEVIYSCEMERLQAENYLSTPIFAKREKIEEIVQRHKSVVVYCKDIATAERMGATLACDVVHSDIDTKETKRRIEHFKANGGVLVNCDILTTGFDMPDLEAVVIDRKTSSLGLYMQIVGRVMRVGGQKYVYDLLESGKPFGRIEKINFVGGVFLEDGQNIDGTALEVKKLYSGKR